MSKPLRFTIVQDPINKGYFWAISRNGRIMSTSSSFFTTRASCEKAVRSLISTIKLNDYLLDVSTNYRSAHV